MLHELTASELRARYAAGEASPVEVIDGLLERIGELEPQLHAFTAVTGELARSQAEGAEDLWGRLRAGGGQAAAPALLGIPVTLKDLIDVGGIPTTMGSLVTDRTPARRDEILVERLRAAGAIIVGKTNTSEFGLAAQTMNRLGEPTANPWNPARTAGGSSGGAAAACAARLGPLHHGTDGGGSVRVPAAYCGVVGLKPSGRRIPRHERGAGMSQISTDGPLARSVADAALMLQVMAGPDERDITALPAPVPDFTAAAENPTVAGLNIAWTTSLSAAAPCQPAVEERFRAALSALSDAGALLHEETPEIPDPLDIFPALSAVGAAANYGKLVEGREEELADYTAGSIRRGKRLSGIEIAEAYVRLDRLQAAMRDFFSRHDLLATPTSAVTAHEHGARISQIAGQKVNPWMISIFFTPIANLIQAPAISVPTGFDPDGLPTAIQLIGKPGDEEAVIRCAAAIEQAMPWLDRAPPL